jgi:NAD(P)-dependent dehydrogenase (short-subunit alcohol dehydrogenase family)
MATGTKPVDFNKPLDPSVLEDRVAIVTGAAAGIGKTIATALAHAGAWVGLGDVNVEAGKALERELSEKGGKAKFVKMDVADWDSQANAFEEVISWAGKGGVDVVSLQASIFLCL